MGAHVSRGAPSRGRRGDDGVSPVIGMVLILAISVLGIVAVTNWGLPAIVAMQQNVQVRAVLNEFTALDASMQKLIAGTTGQTTFKWQPAIGDGAIDVDPTGSRWLVAADATATINFTWDDASDTNNAFKLASNNSAQSVAIQAWKWSQGVATELRVVGSSGSCTSFVGTVPTTPTEFFLKTNATSGCTAVGIDNAVVSFRIKDSGAAATVFHEAFLADVGHVHWNSIVGVAGPQHVYHSNGAVYSGAPDSFVVESNLAVAPPRDFKNSTGVDSTSIFVRLVKVNGTASFSGSEAGQRPAVFLDFVGTYTLGSIDTVKAVNIYVWGPLQNSTYDALTRASLGYEFIRQATPGGQVFVRDTETTKPFRFASAYTLVEVEA